MFGLVENTWVQLILGIVWICCGVGNTVTYTIQNEIFTEGRRNDEGDISFTSSLMVHILSQQLQMFIGMFIFCFPFYLVGEIRKYLKKIVKKKDDEDAEFDYPFLPPRSKFVYLLSSSADLIGSSLVSIGLYYSLPTTTTMLRDTGLIFTSLISLILRSDGSRFDSVNRKHKILGLLLITIGSIGVLIVSPDGKKEEYVPFTKYFGGICIIAANIVYGGFYYVEEILFSGRDVSPMEIVSMEGFFGVIQTLFIIVLLKTFSSTSQMSIQISKEVVLLVIFIGTYNLFGNSFLVLTLERGTRVLLTFLRVVLLWIIQVVWRRKEEFSMFSICSYLVIFCGVLMFHLVNPVSLFLKYFRRKKKFKHYVLDHVDVD